MALHRAFDAAKEVGQVLKTVRGVLDRVAYPYALARVGASSASDTPTISEFLGPSSCPTEPAGAFNYGTEVLARLEALEGRIVSSLVAVAERIETAHGLPPWPDPPGAGSGRSQEELTLGGPGQ